jgi:hypothetical protein
MASGTISNHAKYLIATGGILLDSHDLRIMLMRDGYTFNKDNVANLKNISATDTADDISFTASSDTIASAALVNFATLGIIPGNQITVSGSVSNNGTFTVVTVGTLSFTVAEALVDESAGATVTITSRDELADGNGYADAALSGGALTEDDANDRAEYTCNDVTWTASGGDIGPSPGAIIWDDEATDDPVVGYLDFGADQTAASGSTFNILNIKIRVV